MGKHAFKCSFCENEYSEFQGQHYSEEVSKKGETKNKCNRCGERFVITSNIKGDLVTYKDPIIKDMKKYYKENREKRKLEWSEKEVKYVKKS